jgi:uncharacterized protein YjbI with pentapeptide repeats
MANSAHLLILKDGVETWNKWRRDGATGIAPDLDAAELVDTDLGIDFRDVRLYRATLQQVSLADARLEGAILSGALIENCNFTGCDLKDVQFTLTDILFSSFKRARLELSGFMWAHVVGSDFSYAVLEEAVLTYSVFNRTDLKHASMRHADATLASFIDSDLVAADFSGARFGWTTFSSLSLPAAEGLERAEHRGPSMVALQVLQEPLKLPESFLRGVGLSESAIKQTGQARGNKYHSCFISYSSADQGLADVLYKDLQDHGVRCWLATEDLKIGEQFRTRIDESILSHDKLLLVLSRESVDSPWVRTEVETALEKEQRSGTSVLFPIRLDDAVMESKQAWAADIRRTRHIGDFRVWGDADSYAKALARLLRDLESPLALLPNQDQSKDLRPTLPPGDPQTGS